MILDFHLTFKLQVQGARGTTLVKYPTLKNIRILFKNFLLQYSLTHHPLRDQG